MENGKVRSEVAEQPREAKLSSTQQLSRDNQTGREIQSMRAQNLPQLVPMTFCFGITATSFSSGANSSGKRVDVPALSRDQFAVVANRVFEKIDKDGSGKVSRDEIDVAMEDSSITGQDAQALAAMYANFDELANLSRTQGCFESRGVTKSDINELDSMGDKGSPRVRQIYALKVWLERNLDKYDRSKDGVLSMADLAAGISDPTTSKADRDMLSYARNNYHNVGSFDFAGVSIKTVENAYFERLDVETNLTAGIDYAASRTSDSQKVEISKALFADGKDPLKSIVPEAVRQGTIGNCYFAASLAAVAKSNPASIRDMIKANEDGTYTVTFPNAKNEPVIVKAPTEAEQGRYNRGSEHGIWASVLEKAYGKYSQKIYRRGIFNLSGGHTPAEGGDGGGTPETTMTLLTGHSTDTDVLRLTSQATIARKLEDAFSSLPPKAVAASIHNTVFWKNTSDNFRVAHAYSITGFVSDGKGGGSITIRNPWGGKDGTTRGIITVPLETFMKNFSRVIFEER